MALKESTPSHPSHERSYRARWYRHDLTTGLIVSVVFHVGLFAWRGEGTPKSRPAYLDDVPTLALAKMPALEPEPTPPDEVVTLRNATPQAPEVLAPPTQTDFPQHVTVDAFVQPISVPVARTSKLTMTARILPSGWGSGQGYGRIFDPSALDQMAIPTIQMQPAYPEALRRRSVEGTALVEFIVDAKGNVHDPHCLEATHPDFAWAAVDGVKKWRFQPGKKAGRPVATRLRQLIIFSLKGPGS